MCFSELSIRSTFNFPLHLRAIDFKDAGLRFEQSHVYGARIAPDSVTTVGYIYFEPSQFCGMYCNVPTNMAESTALPKSNRQIDRNNLHYFDENELRQYAEFYRHFKWYFQKIEIILTTRELTQIPLELIIEVQWPQWPDTQQILPTIEVNRKQNYNLIISNPVDKPILVDYFAVDSKSPKDLDLLQPMQVLIIVPDFILTDQSFFTLGKVVGKKHVLIPAGSSITVPIKFQTRRTSVHCSLLYMRNNRTPDQEIWISARSMNSQSILDRQHSGSMIPLRFTLSQRKLSEFCAKQRNGFDATSNKTSKGHTIMSQV